MQVGRTFWTAVCFLVASVGIAPLAAATPVSTAQTSRTDILGLISQTPVVEPDGDLNIRLRVTGAPTGAMIRVDVHGRVPTRTDFQASLLGRNLRTPVPGSPVTVPATPDESDIVVVSVATRDPQSSTAAEQPPKRWT